MGGLSISPSVVYPAVAPWMLEWPVVDWRLLEERRAGRGVDLVGAFEGLVRDWYGGFTLVYTDGSRDPGTGVTGFGVTAPGWGASVSRRTSDGLGVYTVEMVAVLVALRWVEHARVGKVVVCCDSSSVLASLRSFQSSSRQGLLYEVLMSLTRCVGQGSVVRFLWVPAHVGVEGNEEADALAKGALGRGGVDMRVRLSKEEAKGVVRERANQLWQARWDGEAKGRHLYQVQQSVRGRAVSWGSRREETVWMRLRLGHCALNGTLKLVGRHLSGLCEGCGVEVESVEHVLLECRAYEEQRRVMGSRLRGMGVQGMGLKDVLCDGGRAKALVVEEFLRGAGVYDRV